MGLVRTPEKVNLITGLIYNDKTVAAKALKDLIRVFGDIDLESPEIDFTYTRYYDAEFGKNLKRKFLGFKKTAGLDGIHKTKLVTNKLEDKYSISGKRRINIDPGYIELSKLVLFSTKDFSHRIYLANGIYAEITLLFKDGHFTALPWTYPDYKSEEYLRILESVRALYKNKVDEKRCL